MAEKKKAGFFRKTIDKVRKKIAPTFDEQFDKAKKSGKKTFRSTRAVSYTHLTLPTIYSV